MAAPDTEGLPWPEGDPRGLREGARRLDALAEALARQGRRLGTTAHGAGEWRGQAAAAFEQAIANDGRALDEAARALRASAGALVQLAGVVEEAQRTIGMWVSRVREAEDRARQAQARAQEAQAAASPLLSPGLGLFPSLEEQSARDAAVRAQGEADQAWADARQVRRRAESEAEAAVKRVADADRAAAGVLDQTAAGAPAGGSAGIPRAELPAPPPRKGNVFGAFFSGLFAGDFDQEGYDSTGLELSRAVGQTISGLVAVGDVRDVAGNVSHGNWGGAGLSAFGVVPLFGDAAKIVKSGDNVVDAAKAARRAEIAKRISDNAARYMKRMDESVGGHSFARHGAGTTLDEQRRYAKEGVTPDGVKKRHPSNASRFLSHQDQLHAIQRAMTIRRQLGWDEVQVDMGRVVGEGYLAGGEEYVRTRWVVARFRPGEDYPYTAFPNVSRGDG